MEATPEALDSVGELSGYARGRQLPGDDSDRAAGRDAVLARGLAKLLRAGRKKAGQPRGRWEFIWRGRFFRMPSAACSLRASLAPDIGVFDRLFEAAEGRCGLMTLAPELPGAVELAAHATARGRPHFVGHSDATAAETRAPHCGRSRERDAHIQRHAALDHREPGILGGCSPTDALYAELICDGIHNAPEMVRLWWRAKGPERAILVTDAMSATGMPDGEYQLGEITVQVANGRAMARGVLAGSVLTLDRALTNFVAFTGATVEEGAAAVDGESGGDDGAGRRDWAAGGGRRGQPGGGGWVRRVEGFICAGTGEQTKRS